MLSFCVIIKLCAFFIFVTSYSDVNAALAGVQIRTPEQGLRYYLNTWLNNKTIPRLPKGFLTTDQIIKRNGFGYEEHKVVTDDGYVLTMHHIVSDIPGGPPVIFQHGFVSASDTILSQGRNVGLGFLLAQAGYDVWLPDLRGGWYSHEHLKYKTTDPKFWDFTFHEMGYYDVPAAIDKILDVTGYKQVFFIGHSMGCTVFFVMASLRPEYDRKVRAAVMLAPVAYTPTLQELKSKSFRSFLQEAEPFYNYVIGRSVYELFPRGYQSISIVRALCSPSPIQNLCFDIVALGFGENRRNLNRETFGNELSHYPAGSSVRTAHHFTQIYKRGFRFYDYGVKENLRRYKRAEPPMYPLRNITAPVALYWGSGDVLTGERAVKEMGDILPNLIKIHHVRDPKFTHLDFIHGMNNRELVNLDVVNLFHSFL